LLIALSVFFNYTYINMDSQIVNQKDKKNILVDTPNMCVNISKVN